MIVSVALMPAGADKDDPILRDGDPLRLYIRRSPIQNLTFLRLYDSFNKSMENKPEYVLNLGPRGSGTDKAILYQPTSAPDNSLKYEPNASIQAAYSFSILGKVPPSPVTIRYKLLITIEFDLKREGNFKADRKHDFRIEGLCDSRLYEKRSNLSISAGDLRKMDPVQGGRIRVTIAREDFEDTQVSLYTGYREGKCEIVLPMSKYTYAGRQDEDGGRLTFFIFLLALAAFVMVAYVFFSWKNKKKEEDKPQPKSAKRRKKGKTR